MISYRSLWCATYAASLLIIGFTPNPMATIIGVFFCLCLLSSIKKKESSK